MQLSELDSLISAEFVFDSQSTDIIIPNKLKPRDPNDEKMAAVFATQFKGTIGEQLMELAGRTCYDSAGTGRPSADFHQNLIKVNHGSVWAHLNVTVEFNFKNGLKNDEAHPYDYALACANRPGVHVRIRPNTKAVVITANVRSIREWLDYEVIDEGDALMDVIATNVGMHLNKALCLVAPAMANDDKLYLDRWSEIEANGGPNPDDHFEQAQPESKIIPPETDEECWISLLVTGSRGLTHEMVRHGFRTGISQRSTRFVDEDTAPWVEHPLITAFKAHYKETNGVEAHNALAAEVHDGITSMKNLYIKFVRLLEAYGISKGVDKFSARKQARGAARGFLGNALYTEVIFSGSVAQWKRILRQRGNAHADLEIMTLSARALPEFQRSNYSGRFLGFKLAESPLHVGNIVHEYMPEKKRRN